MMQSRKSIKLFGQWTIILFIGVFITLNIVQAQQPIFRIGIIDNAGGPIEQGAELAVQEINASGGVIGADGTAFLLQLVTQPPGDIEAAVGNINQASVIAVIGPETTGQVLGGMTALQSLNVPVLTPAIGDTIIASDTTGRIFRTRAAEILQGRALANYFVNELNITNVATVQLDLESTAPVIGFSTSISGLGVSPAGSFLLADGSTTIEQIVENVTRLNLQALAVYGAPDLAAELYKELTASGWGGVLAYNQANSPNFRNNVQVEGILSTSTWPYTARDEISSAFLTSYVQTFGDVPNAVAASSYDAIYMLAEAIGMPGALQSNISNLNDFEGVQGVLSPSSLARGETSNNVAVTRLNAYGAPQVQARYMGTERLPEDTPPPVITGSPTPQPTPTLDGVYLTIQSAVQNVRTGPSTQYDVLGQLAQGETARIIGANTDFSWVVINYRGQNGWLFANLVEITGDRGSIPVLAIPPTPTPGPPTATPTALPFADIVILSASPTNVTIGVPFSIQVTVQNQGTVNAGAFAVAANFPPDPVFSAVNLGGLAAGQQTTITLTGTFTAATGPQSVSIVADLNSQVDEGPAGEANNANYTFNYVIDRPILNAGTLTLNPGSSLNLEGSGTIDLQWNGTGTSLDAQNGAGVYLIPGVTSLSQVYYDLIDPALATTVNLNVALLPNAYIGIKTAEGNRGVVHVDNVVSGGQITLTYRVYQP